jgi:hypothetical protein
MLLFPHIPSLSLSFLLIMALLLPSSTLLHFPPLARRFRMSPELQAPTLPIDEIGEAGE